jgi:hypothetical protein
MPTPAELCTELNPRHPGHHVVGEHDREIIVFAGSINELEGFRTTLTGRH